MNFILLNIQVTNYLYGLASSNIWTEYLAIFLSDGIFVLAICAYVFVMLPLRKRGKYVRTIFHDLMPAVVTGLSVVVMKLFMNVDRPFVSLGFNPFVPQPDPHSSFPSFHAAVFSAFAFTVFFHHRKFGIFLLSLLPLVMIGRIAIGVHWLNDVLFGALIGFLISFRIYFKTHKSKDLAQKYAEKVLRRLDKKLAKKS